ncbi:MAG: hypothetical protein FJX76_14395 [Armatimonadetes bacterium]|nr:hypothetical protein [Armatimonadota bacterium]
MWTRDNLPPDWMARAVLAGFAGTVTMVLAMIVSYVVALFLSGVSLPDARGALGNGAVVETWLHNLTHNPVVNATTDMLYGALAVHLLMGLFWAVAYARYFEPYLRGGAWEKGMLFSLLPWVLSLVVFLPLVGGGFMGATINAGPLPTIGNLLLHLVYGATLGMVYGPLGDVLVEDVDEDMRASEALVLRRAEGTAAKGILIGLIVGFAVGMLGFAIGRVGHTSIMLGLAPSWFVLTTVVMGGSLGALVGSLVGLPTSATMRNHTAPHA